jgi:methylenetetrahydrofolate reductase (NADPH)
MLNELTKDFINDFSVEVTPKVFKKNKHLIQNLPKNTHIYIAHIEGFKSSDMISAAKEIVDLGYIPVPHIAARQIKDKESLADLIKAYKNESGVSEALLIAGSNKKVYGNFESSLQLIKTGLFDSDFKRIYFAGHPEGNKDIEASSVTLDESLGLKENFSNTTDAEVILTTQFCFDDQKVIDWANQLVIDGINLPVHIGVAGPTKLSNLMKYSIDCGIGPSIKILEDNFLGVGKLLSNYSPSIFLDSLASKISLTANTNIKKVHFYPFGGIKELLNLYS